MPSSISLQEIRVLYSKADESYTNKRRFFEAMQGNSAPDSVPISTWWAYQACVEAIKAKDGLFPFDKLGRIHKAQGLFRRAIRHNPDDLEARFLRFSIQINTPRFLGLSGELQQDLTQLVSKLTESDLSQDMKEGIAGFLLESGQCTTTQQDILKTLLPPQNL